MVRLSAAPLNAASPSNRGALTAAVRPGTPTLGTFIGSASPVAAEAVRHLRYPPAGDRGVATYNRACRFGLDPGALDRANSEVLGVVQIESAAEFGRARATLTEAGAPR